LITPDYCRTMARYNAWQNNGIRKIVDVMDEDALRLDRGAFFGSILGTLNHLLWGDQLWMSRFDGGDGPTMSIPESVNLTPSPSIWFAERFRTDGRITEWARQLTAVDLTGDLTWFSGAMNQTVTRPFAFCVTHFFNHQTHHRGQIHAMLTAAGQQPQDSDLFFLPEG